MQSTRTRTPTSFYTVQPKTPSGASGLVVEAGPGRPLGEIESLSLALDAMTASEELVQQLHLLLFGSLGTRYQRKKHIKSQPSSLPLPWLMNHRMFSGFPSAKVSEDKRSRLKEKRKFWTLEELRKALAMLDLPVSGPRDDLVDRLIDFLACPVTAALFLHPH